MLVATGCPITLAGDICREGQRRKLLVLILRVAPYSRRSVA